MSNDSHSRRCSHRHQRRIRRPSETSPSKNPEIVDDRPPGPSARGGDTLRGGYEGEGKARRGEPGRRSSRVGAWCIDGNALSFVSFFPALVCASKNQNMRSRFSSEIVWYKASRAFLANTVLASVSGKH